MMTRNEEQLVNDRNVTDTASQSERKQHHLGEGTAQEKSGGPSHTGDPEGHHGTTPGMAEGKEADVDQALEQQGKPKPR